MIGNGHAGFGRAASEKDPQGHLAGVVPRRPAIPARSRPAGRPSGCSTRCVPGRPATAVSRHPTIGRARTPAAAADKRWNDSMTANGRRQASSATCLAAGRPRERPRTSSHERNRAIADGATPPVLDHRRLRCMPIEWAPGAAQGPKPCATGPKSAEIGAPDDTALFRRLQAKELDGARLRYRLRRRRCRRPSPGRR